MMRKFAITVFALSLTALGCGSDSGTPVADSGHAGDTAVTTGAEAGAPKDTGSTLDAGATVDVPGVDVASADVAAPSDVAQPADAGQITEAGKPDAPPLPVDGGPRIDGLSVDSNAQADVAAPTDVSVAGEAGLAADSGATD